MSILRFALACLLFLSSPAFAASYTVRVLGASATPSTAAGINQAGDVAGLTGNTPFAWHAGSVRFIEQPGQGFSTFRGQEWQTLGVDNTGGIEAYYTQDTGATLARYDAGGLHVFNIAPLAGDFDVAAPLSSFLTGQVSGGYHETLTGRHGYFLSQGTDLVPFTLLGWTEARPFAVNTLGWVAGAGLHNGRQAGFLLRGGNVSDLGAFVPNLLNDRGNLASGATVWIGNREYTIAPLAGVPGTPIATGINNLGQIVGAQGTTPFYWSPSGGTEPLILPTDPDWNLLFVRGISDAGMIAATGQSVNVASPHALLLLPFGRFTPAGSRP